LTLKVKKTPEAVPAPVASQKEFRYSVNMRCTIKHTLVLLLTVLLWGCSRDNQPQGILDEERFETIYIALLDSAQQVRATAVDSGAHPVALRILERYGATVEQFKATVAYYNSDTERWKDFFQRVIRRLEERRMPKANQ
jgi:hypothetical protein